MLPKVLHILYELDVLGEEVILHWHKNPAKTDDAEVRAKQQQVRKQVGFQITVSTQQNFCSISHLLDTVTI